MPRPGTDVFIVDDAARGGAILDTSQAFAVGVTGDGDPNTVEKVTSLSAYETAFGDRTDGSLMYDGARVFFAEGGGTLYVSPVAGPIAQASMDAALAAFDYALGPGQVMAPGLTDTVAHTAVLAHCDATDRCALLDLPDSPTPAALTTAVEALQGDAPNTGLPGVRMAAAFAPWVVYPSDAQGATITAPYSALQAALIARADAGGNPNEPAAGANGVASYALGLSQAFTDAERTTLNDAGICMAKMVYGAVETYGYRTAAGPADPAWTWFSNSRVVMAIAHECDAIGENYVLRQIDGKGHVIAAFETALRGVLLNYYNAGALYGTTPEEAFTVNTGSQVNTDETIANGEIHAVVRLRCSPAAEWVVVEIVKVPVERAVAA